MNQVVQQGFGEFAKAAFSGPNAYIFIALNLLALAAVRSLGARRGAAFGIAALLSALLGSVQVVEKDAFSLSGLMTGAIVGAGFSAVVGYGLIYAVAKLKLPTMAELMNGTKPPPTTKPPEEAPQATQPPQPPPPPPPPAASPPPPQS